MTLPNNEKLRLFIAIELDKSLKESLKTLQDELKKCGADVGWVKPENIHLTLKFLGETEPKSIARISAALEETAGLFPPFTLNITHVGFFPEQGPTRIVWAGLDKGKDESARLADFLEDKLSVLGFKKEKRGFSPHVTIGRVRSEENLYALRKTLSNFHFKTPLTQTTNHLTLFKSTLTPQGPIYEPLRVSTLKP